MATIAHAADAASVTQDGSSSALPWALFEHTFRDVGEAVVLADTERRIVLANPATTALFGYPASELMGRKTRLLYADPLDFEARGRERYHPGATDSHDAFVVRYRRADGAEFTGETIGGPIRDERGQVVGYLGIIKDISARLSAEQVLNRLHLITSDEALGFRQRLHAILALGAEHFGLPLGILSQIEGDTYTVRDSVSPDGGLAEGTTFELGDTYCSHTLRADGPVGFHHAGRSEIREHPCYQTFGLEAYLGAPIRVGGKRYGTLNFSSPAPTRPFTGQDLEIVRLMAQWAGHEIGREADLRALEAARAELERLATTDGLTGLLNRRAGTRILEEEVKRAARYGTPLSVVLLDLDHFKRLNDTLGHDAGDTALRHIAALGRRTLRETDRLVRWGGEEFLLILPETAADNARTVAERLLSRLRETPFDYAGESVRLTASAGGATYSAGKSPDALIQCADERLYAAKAAGRDRYHAG